MQSSDQVSDETSQFHKDIISYQQQCHFLQIISKKSELKKSKKNLNDMQYLIPAHIQKQLKFFLSNLKQNHHISHLWKYSN